MCRCPLYHLRADVRPVSSAAATGRSRLTTQEDGMPIRPVSAILIATLLAACGSDATSPGPAVDVTGTFIGDYTATVTPGTIYQGVLQLTQTGGTVTGTLTTNAGRSADVSGHTCLALALPPRSPLPTGAMELPQQPWTPRATAHNLLATIPPMTARGSTLGIPSPEAVAVARSTRPLRGLTSACTSRGAAVRLPKAGTGSRRRVGLAL